MFSRVKFSSYFSFIGQSMRYDQKNAKDLNRQKKTEAAKFLFGSAQQKKLKKKKKEEFMKMMR